MQVELGDSLLSTQGPDILLLLAICAFGFMGRHRIITHDRAKWEQWAQKLPAILADELRLVWDDGEKKAAIGATAERLEVRTRGILEVQSDRIIANPQDAFALLGRPFRIILENGRTDRLFLLAFADKATRKLLESAEKAGWLAFETAGGIGELRLRLAQDQDDVLAIDALRVLYLCDSDAREPTAFSSEAVEIGRCLERLAKRFQRRITYFGRVLTRRAVENYAPPGELLAWAHRAAPSEVHLIAQITNSRERAALSRGPGAANTPRRRLLAALALRELQPKIRAHIDMKEGRGESPPYRTSDVIWDQLDEFQKAVLRDGFGTRLAVQFYGTSSVLPDESGEIVALLEQIMERL